MLSNLFSEFLNNLLPAQCTLCCAILPSTRPRKSFQSFCFACQAQLPHWVAAESCPQCARPGTHGLLCGECLQRPPAFDQTFAVYIFVDPIKSLIHAAKFGGQWHLLGSLAQFKGLATQLTAVDWIVPLPLHGNRLKERGFNQAQEIAQSFSQAKGLAIRHDVLIRVKDTEHQARLSAKARWKNLRHAFACQADCSGKTILLVDDVMTSGASLHAAAKVLKAAGALHIINLVLARTPSQPNP